MSDTRTPDKGQASAGGWGALNATERQLVRQKILLRGNRALLNMNKPGGFDCPSCAWPDPRIPHKAQYCENGAKAVAWEATAKRTTVEFLADHTRRSSTRRAPGWFFGKCGSIAAHASSDNQNNAIRRLLPSRSE